MSEPTLTFENGEWCLAATYQREVRGKKVTILKGFSFDLASIPRPIWPIIAPFELSLAAPMVHDYFYRWRGAPPLVDPEGPLTRWEVDRMFLEVMKEEGISAWRRTMAFWGVRLFGWLPWPPPQESINAAFGRAGATAWQAGVAGLLAVGVVDAPLASLLVIVPASTGLSLLKSAITAWMKKTHVRSRILS